MIVATWFLITIATGLFVYAWRQHSREEALQGLQLGAESLWNLAALLLLAFALSGLIDVLAPEELVRSWLGTEAGWRGLIIGSVAGAFMPGGPYVVFPIMATLYRAGASLGTTVAVVTGWAVWGVISLTFEISIVGPRFSVIRISAGLMVPPLAGFLAQILFGGGF